MSTHVDAAASKESRCCPTKVMACETLNEFLVVPKKITPDFGELVYFPLSKILGPFLGLDIHVLQEALVIFHILVKLAQV